MAIHPVVLGRLKPRHRPAWPRLPAAESGSSRRAVAHARRSRAGDEVERGTRSIIRRPASDRGPNPSASYILATRLTAWCGDHGDVVLVGVAEQPFLLLEETQSMQCRQAVRRHGPT